MTLCSASTNVACCACTTFLKIDRNKKGQEGESAYALAVAALMLFVIGTFCHLADTRWAQCSLSPAVAPLLRNLHLSGPAGCSAACAMRCA